MPTQDSRTARIENCIRPTHRFVCSFCGKSRPECDLLGPDGPLLFCGRCVTALDALHDGADDALAIRMEPK